MTGEWEFTGSVWDLNGDNSLALKSETAAKAETAKPSISNSVYAGVSAAAVSLFACVFMAKRKDVASDDFDHI